MASRDRESLIAFLEQWDTQLVLCRTSGDTDTDLSKNDAFIQKTTENGMGRKSTLRSCRWEQKLKSSGQLAFLSKAQTTASKQVIREQLKACKALLRLWITIIIINDNNDKREIMQQGVVERASLLVSPLSMSETPHSSYTQRNVEQSYHLVHSCQNQPFQVWDHSLYYKDRGGLPLQITPQTSVKQGGRCPAVFRLLYIQAPQEKSFCRSINISHVPHGIMSETQNQRH